MVIVETGKRYWLHLVWCVVLILVMLGQWVAVWGLRANEVWTAAEFFVVMLSPLVFYMAAHLLVSSHPESIESWSSHLDEIKRPLLLLMLLSLGTFFLRSFIVMDLDAASTVLRPSLVAVFIVTTVTLAYPKQWLLAASAIVWLAPVLSMLLVAELG